MSQPPRLRCCLSLPRCRTRQPDAIDVRHRQAPPPVEPPAALRGVDGSPDDTSTLHVGQRVRPAWRYSEASVECRHVPWHTCRPGGWQTDSAPFFLSLSPHNHGSTRFSTYGSPTVRATSQRRPHQRHRPRPQRPHHHQRPHHPNRSQQPPGPSHAHTPPTHLEFYLFVSCFLSLFASEVSSHQAHATARAIADGSTDAGVASAASHCDAIGLGRGASMRRGLPSDSTIAGWLRSARPRHLPATQRCHGRRPFMLRRVLSRVQQRCAWQQGLLQVAVRRLLRSRWCEREERRRPL